MELALGTDAEDLLGHDAPCSPLHPLGRQSLLDVGVFFVGSLVVGVHGLGLEAQALLLAHHLENLF
eukprot:5200819-Prorocentrum_lima.AAC.1